MVFFFWKSDRGIYNLNTKKIRNEFNSKIRNNFIKEHPICQYCGEKAEHVHHLIPIVVGGDNRENNLIPLCMKCHSLIEGKHFSNKWKEAQKLGIERAKKEGRFKGGQPKEKPKNLQDFYWQWMKREKTKIDIAQQLKVSRPTLDKWFKEFNPGGDARRSGEGLQNP